jgi:cytosine/adenosine deaminase-related metal-dependent hydrolase
VTSKILLRGGCVLTLGSKSPNHPRADVLIEDGRVAEVGPGLRTRDAEAVDATDTIVMPGFVDAHRHTWRSLLRNLGTNARGDEIDPPGFGEGATPDDLYAATLAGLLGAVEAGITTVADWADHPAEGGFAEAALQAHADAGLRTVYVLAGSANDDDDAPHPRELAARIGGAAHPATTFAVGAAALDPAAASDWAAAREWRLPIHAHADGRSAGPGAVAALSERGLLGPDVTLLHCSAAGDADLDAIASSGAAIALAPVSDMAAATGVPPVQEAIDHRLRPGLGVDDERLTPGDMFAQMRGLISVQHATVFQRKLAGKAGLPRLMSTRDVIRHATVDGARAAGLAGVTGSLEPGMQADVVVLRTDRPNVFPINDPIGAVVWGMDTSNVDWVFAGGRVLMREGVLQADVAHVRALAGAARERLAADRGPVVGARPGGAG